MKISLTIIAMLIASASLAADTLAWTSFWRSVHVDPPPPESILDPLPFHGKILNLTTGRLTDATVRQWIDADLRRGNADRWAGDHLRRDIADAGILGPPGLNGTSASIDAEHAKGVARIETTDYSETVAVGVIWLSKDDQRAHASLGLTEYVIVHARRMTGNQRIRIFKDGKREPIGAQPTPGELRWQIDTGHFLTHPVLGPLWYQQAGWGCRPDDGSRLGEICARVKP